MIVAMYKDGNYIPGPNQGMHLWPRESARGFILFWLKAPVCLGVAVSWFGLPYAFVIRENLLGERVLFRLRATVLPANPSLLEND
jgi:hypothetical protein